MITDNIIHFPCTSASDSQGEENSAKSSPAKKPKLHSSGLFVKFFRYTDPITGQKKEKKVYGKTEEEAIGKKEAFLKKVKEGLRASENGITVNQWADKFRESYFPNTEDEGYAYVWNYNLKLITDTIGYRKIASIVEADCKKIMDKRIGQSGSTIRKTYMVLNNFFGAAVRNRIIPINPAGGMPVPSGKDGSNRPLEAWEQQLTVKVSQKGHRYGTAAMLQLFCGLRPAESYAIDLARDIDLIKRRVYVRHGIRWEKGKPMMKLPKTAAGIRSVPIPDPLLEYLRTIPLTGYALHMSNNIYALPTRQAVKIAWKSMLTSMEEEYNGSSYRWRDKTKPWMTLDINKYDYRHTWFTTLYNAGVKVHTASKWGGHASINTTMKIYVHLTEQKELEDTKQYYAYDFSSILPFARPSDDKRDTRRLKLVRFV